MGGEANEWESTNLKERNQAVSDLVRVCFIKPLKIEDDFIS